MTQQCLLYMSQTEKVQGIKQLAAFCIKLIQLFSKGAGRAGAVFHMHNFHGHEVVSQMGPPTTKTKA